MKPTPIRYVIVMMLFATMNTCSVQCEEPSTQHDVLTKLHVLQTSDWSPDSARTFLIESFSTMSDAERNEIANSTHIQAAVYANWWKSGMIGVFSPKSGFQSSLNIPCNESEMRSRAVGFLEGKSGIQVPDWWGRLLINGDLALLEKMQDKIANAEGEEVWLGRILPQGFSAERGISNHWRIWTKDNEASISLELIQSLFPDNDAPSEAPVEQWGIAIDVSTLYLSSSSVRAGYPFVIHAIDLEQGKVIWTRKIWNCEGGLIGGPASGYHFSELRLFQDKIVAFGTATGKFYVECFSARTGKESFRLATNLWDTHHVLNTTDP